MKRQFLFIAIIAFSMAGCLQAPPFGKVSPLWDLRKNDSVMDLHPGMSKDQAIELMGYPNNRATFKNNVERWYYHNKHQILVFQNNTLTALEYDKETHHKKMEIEKAREGATKITNTINNTGSESSSSRCTHHNIYGNYPKGGGCNVYGCWPAGGNCNVFGCSSSKPCTALDCPDEIDSYKCSK